jgi:hypothetical protein
MADSIHQVFDDLRIRPAKDKDTGVVYFQKIDTLKASTQSSKELCLTIAYFFIRIFQIFGALAITITDDPGAPAVLGAAQYAPQVPIPPTVQTERRGVFGPTRRIPGSRGTYMRGGGPASEYNSTWGGGQVTYDMFKVFEPIDKQFEPWSGETLTIDDVEYKVFKFSTIEDIRIIPGHFNVSVGNRKSQNMKITLNPLLFLYGNMNIRKNTNNTSITSETYDISIDNFRLLMNPDLVDPAGTGSEAKKELIKTAIKELNTSGAINRFPVKFSITTYNNGDTFVSDGKPFEIKLKEVINAIRIKINTLFTDAMEEAKKKKDMDELFKSIQQLLSQKIEFDPFPSAKSKLNKFLTQ